MFIICSNPNFSDSNTLKPSSGHGFDFFSQIFCVYALECIGYSLIFCASISSELVDNQQEVFSSQRYSLLDKISA